jgi:cytochrome c553
MPACSTRRKDRPSRAILPRRLPSRRLIPWPPSTALLAHGKEIYQNGLFERSMPACAACHGAQAQGIPSLSPALAGQSSAYIARQLTQWHAGALRGPTGNFMQAEAAKLSPQDIQALAAYLGALPPPPESRANGDGQ